MADGKLFGSLCFVLDDGVGRFWMIEWGGWMIVEGVWA
jgi:hypothetical protein